MVWERPLPEQLRVGRLGHVQDREIDRRVFVCDVEDAPPIGCNLHRDPLAGVWCAAKVMLRQQLEVVLDPNGRQSGHDVCSLHRPGRWTRPILGLTSSTVNDGGAVTNER